MPGIHTKVLSCRKINKSKTYFILAQQRKKKSVLEIIFLQTMGNGFITNISDDENRD